MTDEICVATDIPPNSFSSNDQVELVVHKRLSNSITFAQKLQALTIYDQFNHVGK